MTIWICATCGIENPDSDTPPITCAICSDDRQWVPASGQQWTTPSELEGEHEAVVTELEPDLFGIAVAPGFAIGQRSLLVRTAGGNLLWEPSGYRSASLSAAVRELGGVSAVAMSHPHMLGSSISWSQEYDGVPVYFNADDKRWIQRPDDAVTLWQDHAEPLPGIRLVQVGGHFPGSCVAHWAAGAGGAGALLAGDSIAVSADRVSVSFLRSYPNRIPLSERLVRNIVAAVEPLAYDRVYGAFAGWVVESGAKRAVRESAERYIGWLRDEIRDPDERLDRTI